MKQTLIIFVFILISSSSIGQWHYKYCEVDNINHCTAEEFQYLWQKVNKNIKTGAILTPVGTTSIAVGWAASAHLQTQDSFMLEFMAIPVGIVLNLIGIPATLSF